MSTDNETPEAGAEPAQQLAPAAPAAPKHLAVLEDHSPVSPFASMTSFEKAQRVARALASSTMVPEAYQQYVLKNGQWQENPNAMGNCLVALEMSSRMPGLSPLMVMQNMDVVKGRPSWRGAFAAARVNASPLFSRLKYEWKGEPGTKDYGCRAYATEVETGEVLHSTWITWAMVTGEGWDKNSKWTTMRDQMFTYRAATFWCRAYAPDLLLGLQMADEVEDVVDDRASLRALNDRLNGQQLGEAPAGEAAASAPAPAPDAGEADPPRTTGRRRRGGNAPAAAPLDQAEPADAEKPAAQTAAPEGIAAGPVAEPTAAAPAPAPAPAAGDNYDVE